MAKAENKYGEDINGVEDFERIRGYLDKIYLFGCYSRKNLAIIQGFSGSHVDDTIKLLKKLDFFKNALAIQGRKKSYNLLRKYSTSGQIPLADVYTLRNFFNDEDLFAYLWILAYLNDKNSNGRSEFYLKVHCPFIKNDNTFKARLDSLVEDGYIYKDNDVYKLCNANALSSLREVELYELYNLVQFASATTYPRVAGSFLLRTIEREIYRRTRSEVNTESPYIMRHTTNRNVLDEVLVYQLLFAIEEKRWVRIGKEYLLPIELRYDNRVGRWYCVFARINKDENGITVKPFVKHLGRIKILMPTDPDDENEIGIQNTHWAALKSSLGADCSNESAWNIIKEGFAKQLKYNLFGNFQAPEVIEVTAAFEFYDIHDQKRFENEIGRYCIKSSKNIENKLVVTIQTSDVYELLPILRSYAPYMTELNGGDSALIDVLFARTEEMLLNIGQEFAIFDSKESEDSEDDPTDTSKKTVRTNKDKTREVIRTIFSQFQNREFQQYLDLFARLTVYGSFNKTQFETRLWGGGIGVDDSSVHKEILDKLIKYKCIVDKGINYERTPEFDPYLPMSAFERDYLRFVLELPEAELFLNNSLREKLRQTVEPGYFDLLGGSINNFGEFDRNACPDAERIKCFKEVFRAVKNKKLLELTFANDENTGEYFAWKLEYRGLDRKWWLIYCDNGKINPKRVALEDICRAQCRSADAARIDDSAIEDALEAKKYIGCGKSDESEIVLWVTDGQNAIERCLVAFENFEAKSVRFLGYDAEGNSVYEIRLMIYSFFDKELIRTLMGLGAKVRYISGPQRITFLLKEQCQKALENIGRSIGIDR